MNIAGIFRTFIAPPKRGNDIQSQREHILSNILVGMSILGILLLIAYSPVAVRENRWIPLGIFIGIYFWTFSITVFRRLPYLFRSTSLLLIIYALGSLTLFQDGLPGNSRIYFMTFAIITGILLGLWRGLFALAVSGLTIGIFYYLTLSGLFQYPPISVEKIQSDGPYLTLALVAFLIVGLTTTISMVTLLKGLEKSVINEKSLASSLAKERQELEIRIKRHTEDLERRLVQIRTAAEITRSISTVLDPNELLQQVVELLKERFNLYYVGIFILDRYGEYAELRAGSGEAGVTMIAAGHKLAAGGSSMIGWSIVNRQARIALDVGQEAVRFNNLHLPLTRSELALPLISSDHVVGAVTVQSSEPAAFDQDDITVLQGIADSIASALENAHLFHQVQENLDEIKGLHQQYLVKAWSQASQLESDLAYTYEGERFEFESTEALIELPVTLRDHVIGEIELQGALAKLSPDDLIFVEAITTEAAIALENVRLLGETKRRAERERLISEVASRIRASTEVETILQTALLESSRILRASSGIIRLEMTPPTLEEPKENGSNGNLNLEALENE